MILYRKVSVVSDYMLNMIRDCQISNIHVQVPGVLDHSRVHKYLVVDLCKFGTTFCVNFEQ